MVFFNLIILERVLGIVSYESWSIVIMVLFVVLFKVLSHSSVNLDQSALLIFQNCGSWQEDE